MIPLARIVGYGFFAFLFCCVGHGTPIAGEWNAEFDSEVGPQKYTYTFSSEGEKLTGKADWQRMGTSGSTPLTEGTISDQTVSFVEIAEAQGEELRIVYKGNIEGDALKLTRQVGDFGTETFVAHRTASAAASTTRVAASSVPTGATPPLPPIATGPYQPSWDSLVASYKTPDWFRNAKFGIWAHWSAQCVPEHGDWYARNMYEEGSEDYAYQLEHYGHPSKFGFMEFDNLWKAEKWDPEKMMDLYARAGAKYFVALANHHDNFDTYDSKYQSWNSVRVGPKKDIVGTWAKIARAHGLRFGVSNHSSHAWHWFQVAYGHDVDGPLAGVPYDAATLTKADGKGKWWEGLDPQDLYCGLRIPMPNDLKTAKEAEAWHAKNDGHWYETIPPNDNGYSEKWFLRAQDLVDKYHPDLVYFDDDELPLEQYGLGIAAHYYNANLNWHNGNQEGVINGKHVRPERVAGIVPDIERGVAEGIRPEPWQTDTCIGSWHYDRRIFEKHGYKTVEQVVQMLSDIVSKNGNLLLSIPVRGNGELDEDEIAFLKGLAKWMDVNSECIFATRPWTIYGEGPSTSGPIEKGPFGAARDVRKSAYTSADLRFTVKDKSLYAIVLKAPSPGANILVNSLARGSAQLGNRQVTAVSLLGSAEKLHWNQDSAGLHVTLPPTLPGQITVSLKIEGAL